MTDLYSIIANLQISSGWDSDTAKEVLEKNVT